MSAPVDIRPQDLAIVHAVVKAALPPNAKIYVFGSRATWTTKDSSDLDLAIDAGRRLTPKETTALAEAFEDSNLPYRVDVVDMHNVSDSFKAVIDRDRVRLPWQEITLREVGHIVTGKTPPTSDAESYGGNIPFVTPSDMDGRRVIEKTARTLTSLGASKVRSSLVQRPSVVVSCIGSDMGKTALVAGPFVSNQQINSITVADEFDRLFVYYNLSARKDEIRNKASGAAQPIMNKSDFGNLKISVPELSIQKTIGSALSALDDKIELKRRMNETLEGMAQAIFKDWFVDFGPVRRKLAGATDPVAIMGGLTPTPELAALFPDGFAEDGLPEGWRVSTLGNHMTNFDSKRVPVSGGERAKRKGTYPYHGATGVMDYVDNYLFDGIYLLVGEDGSVVKENGLGFTQYVWGQFWVNNHAHVLQGKGNVSTEQLLLYFQHVPVSHL